MISNGFKFIFFRVYVYIPTGPELGSRIHQSSEPPQRRQNGSKWQMVSAIASRVWSIRISSKNVKTTHPPKSCPFCFQNLSKIRPLRKTETLHVLVCWFGEKIGKNQNTTNYVDRI